MNASRWRWTLLGVGTLLRLALAASVLHAHPPQWFFSKASEYGELATHVLSGCGLCAPFGVPMAPSAFLGPGYPLMIALMFHLFGSFSAHAEAAIILLQTLFECVAGWLLIDCARRLFDDRASLLTGALWALAVPLMFFGVIFWESSFSFLVLATLLHSALVLRDRADTSSWALFGVAAVLGYFVNPALLPVSAILFLWIVAVTRRRDGMRSAVLTAVLCILAMSVWPVRNWRSMHAFIPARDNFGYELWQGNHAGANGFFDSNLHPNANAHERAQLDQLGELAFMHQKSVVSRQWISAHPGEFLRLTLKRIASYWSGYEPGHHTLLLVYAVMIAILGWIGVWRLRGRREFWLLLLPLLIFPLPYYITHPDFRFRELLDVFTFVAIGGFAMKRGGSAMNRATVQRPEPQTP
jgi:hypothetical protein